MSRPDFVSNEDIIRWSDNIDNDKSIPDELKKLSLIREVCYAGLFLSEELEKLHCPDELIVRIQFTAGKLSYGRDAWDIHMDMLDRYKDNTLVFEDDPKVELN